MKKRPSWWFEFLRIVWPFTTVSAKMTQWPVVGRFFAILARPLFIGKNFHVTHIPVNLDVKGGGSSHIPELVLEELIRRSAHRITINRCHCRDSEHCQHYPIEDACLHLGEGTSYLDPHIATPRTVESAIAHMRKMIGMGLIPMIGRVRMDDLFYGTPNTGRSLTVCFCCPCCCMIMNTTRYMPDATQNAIVKLKGLRIAVDPHRCKSCGTCTQNCFMGALRISGEGIVRDEARCKGCGKCISVCPNGVVSAAVSDLPAAVADLEGRISSLIDYR